MKKKLIKMLIVVISVVIIVFFLLYLKEKNNNDFIDSIQYNKKTYVLLEYNMDVFTYNYNNYYYYEEDVIHPIYHNKWNIVYFNGDLFVLESQIEIATKYYTDDINYDWYIVFDNEDSEIKKEISLSDKELAYIYDLEQEDRTNTIVFDDIDKFASILKVSKDGLVQAIITLAQVDEQWYYKTEIMTDDDREYVVKITNTLNEKINNLFIK